MYDFYLDWDPIERVVLGPVPRRRSSKPNVRVRINIESRTVISMYTHCENPVEINRFKKKKKKTCAPDI